MKKSTNILLIIIALIPVILLLGPFAEWNDVMNLILRIIPSVVVQMLLFRIGRRNIIKIIPVLLTGAIAVWGTYLYFTSSHWINATFWDLIADYIFSQSLAIFHMSKNQDMLVLMQSYQVDRLKYHSEQWRTPVQACSTGQSVRP